MRILSPANISITESLLFANCQLLFAALRHYQFSLRTRLVFHDVTGNGAGRHCVGAGQIHLARAAASGEVTVLGADGDLVGAGRYTWTGIDASATAWLNHNRASFLKNVKIALADAIFAGAL